MAKCVLEIRDEVNVKFVGLDVKTRRAISDEAKYFLPYAYHMPSYKLGRWDGCVRYCDIVSQDSLELHRLADIAHNWFAAARSVLMHCFIM